MNPAELPGGIVAVVGLMVKSAAFGPAMRALLTTSDCEPAAAVFETVRSPVVEPFVVTLALPRSFAPQKLFGLTEAAGGGSTGGTTQAFDASGLTVTFTVSVQVVVMLVNKRAASNGPFCVPATAPTRHATSGSLKLIGMMTLNVVGPTASVMLDGDEGTTAPPREKRTNATGSQPRPGFATVTCSAVPQIPLPATFVMTGLTGAYAKTGPFAKSPLAMFVTMVGPLEALHGLGGRAGTAMIWGPVTLSGGG